MAVDQERCHYRQKLKGLKSLKHLEPNLSLIAPIYTQAPIELLSVQVCYSVAIFKALGNFSACVCQLRRRKAMPSTCDLCSSAYQN